MDKFTNRQQAGAVLAEYLIEYRNRSDVIVLALPRGGVPVGFEIAKSLHVPLDVFIVRKLGVPGHEELAMGALAMGDVTVFNEEIVKNLRVCKEDIDTVIQMEQKELDRRLMAYRDNKPLPKLKDKTIILVDDGIATGATMHAAIIALKKMKPTIIVIAVPVAEINTCEKMAAMVDKMICPLKSHHFYAVGQWYDDFSQTSDEEVYRLLRC